MPVPVSSQDLAAFLQPFRLEALETHQGSVCALDAELRLRYTNPAWPAFAAANGEPLLTERWPLGKSILDAIPAVLLPFYQDLFERALNGLAGPEPLGHDYECSTSELYRRFRMTLYPLPQRRGLVVVHSLLVERPHLPDPRAEPPYAYVDEHGLLRQCCHCRRVQHLHEADRWDWVPEWVSNFPPHTSHTLCGVCFDYFYGQYRPAESA